MLVRGWIIAAVLAVPSFALAQPAASPPEVAAPTDEEKKQFSAARDAYEAKKFEEALPKFQLIANETHSLNARLYVARCLVELKRTAEGYDEMKSLANDPNTDPKYAKTREAAQQELAPLEHQVGHLQIQLAAEQKGSAVTVNGKPVPEDKLASLTVLPGTQTVEVNHAGSLPVKQSVEVGAGESKSVSLAPVQKPVEEQKSQGIGTLRLVGIGVAGLGVVSLLAGIGTGVSANGKFSQVQSDCGPTKPCKPSGGITLADIESTIDSGKTLEKASTATFVIGGLLVAASVPLLIIGGPKKADAKADTRTAVVTVRPTFGGAVVGASGQF